MVPVFVGFTRPPTSSLVHIPLVNALPVHDSMLNNHRTGRLHPDLLFA